MILHANLMQHSLNFKNFPEMFWLITVSSSQNLSGNSYKKIIKSFNHNKKETTKIAIK